MYKKITRIIICNLLLLFFGGNSLLYANRNDTCYIKGYYFVIYNRAEIEETFVQEKRAAEGKSSRHMIDFEKSYFFLPIQIGNTPMCEFGTIENERNRFSSNDSIFIFTHESDIRLMKELNLATDNAVYVPLILSEARKMSPYYIIDDNKQYMYKSVYIEGYAIHKDIQDVEKKWRSYLLDGRQKEGNAHQDIFFIDQIIDYTPYIENKRFKKWLPYTK